MRARRLAERGMTPASSRTARVFAGAALAASCALQMLALLRAPAAWMPARVAVVLPRGAALDLDHAALGAPVADGGRLQLRHAADGSWWAAAAGTAGTLLVQDGERRRRSGSVVLRPGQQFQPGALRIGVDAADADAVSLSAGRTTWRYDGALLRRDGRPQPACPDARIGTRLAGLWNPVAPAMLAFGRPLVVGGNLDCGNRIAVAGLPAPAATIARSHANDGFVLAAAPSVPVLLTVDGHAALLAGRPLRLDGGGTLVAGRTRLLLAMDGDMLRLRPAGHVALYPDTAPRLPPGVTWTWTRRAPWDLPAQAGVPLLVVLGLGSAGALAAALGARAGTRLHAGAAAGMGLLLAGAGVVLFWLQRSGAPPGAGVGLAAAWAALAFALLAPRRLDPVLAAALPLLALGLLAQLDLGLGAPDTAWLRHFHKTAALLALACGVATLAALVRPARPLPQARIELALLLTTGAALLALLLQVAYGDETGVFDLQPVEFAKLALAALSAHCLALASADGPAPGGAWRRGLRLAAPALLFMLLLGVALVQVDDYSPLVLLALWAGTMMLAQALATRRRGTVFALTCVGGTAVLAVALLRGVGADGIARWDFYADRFLVWLDPGTHPHTGQRLARWARAPSRKAAGAAPTARSAWRTWASPPASRCAISRPCRTTSPRPSSCSATACLLPSACGCCRRCSSLAPPRLAVRGRRRRQGRARLPRRLARAPALLFLAGGAAFAFGHFLLSWGTNLAIFPVMGQPMSFLSAGG
ncbi:FtsW/RodA/SpoVE family cell cycle protein [Massilia phosphatilytica]